MNFFVLLLAAGQGTRFGGDIPKTFVEFDGSPLWVKSYSTFRSCGWISKVFLTIPQTLENHYSLSVLNSHNDTSVIGGKTRRESVQKALEAISNEVPRDQWENSYVFIHDAARAFLSSSLIERLKDAVLQYQAVTAAIPSVDSVVIVDTSTSKIKNSLPRQSIFRVQTPQVFRLDLIERAHQEYIGEPTDDASMVEPFHPVHIVFGEESNRKVTFLSDLEI